MGHNRASQYSLDYPDYLCCADENIFVMLILETPEAVAEMDRMARIPVIDALWLGTFDTCRGLGLDPHKMPHPEIDSIVARTLQGMRVWPSARTLSICLRRCSPRAFRPSMLGRRRGYAGRSRPTDERHALHRTRVVGRLVPGRPDADTRPPHPRRGCRRRACVCGDDLQTTSRQLPWSTVGSVGKFAGRSEASDVRGEGPATCSRSLSEKSAYSLI